MNPAQLRALLSAGIITQAQYLAASSDPTSRPTIDVSMFAPATVRLEVHDDSEGDGDQIGILTADVVTRYEELIESHGMVIHAGALEPRQPLVKNKLLRDHNHSEPVGYMTGVDDARQAATWRVASTEIDRVQREVDEHLRDGLSVGFSITEYEIDDEWVLHVYRADWYETSLCAIPAVHEAGVTSVAAALATARKENRTMNRAQLAAALAAGQITQEQHDTALAVISATEGTQPAAEFSAPNAAEPPVAVLAGPEEQETPAPTLHVRERVSLSQVTRRLVTAANSGDHAAFQLALADIVPADDAGAAFMREDWQGELWREDDTTRPWIDAFGAPKELKSLKGRGWRWEDEPEVDEYAGNKTEVPSNEIATDDVTFTAFRIAAGWDVDRAFEDFASEEFWGAFWPAVMRSYKRKSNAGIRTRLLAAATAPAGTVTAGGVKAVLKQAIRDVRPYGKANRVFLGDGLYEELEDLDTENLPLWLKSATVGLDIAEGTADVGTLRIQLDETLGDNDVVAFDNRAAIVRERAPFRAQALNIAHAGIDVGIYSYLRLDPQDPRAIVKRTYAPA